MPKRAALLAVLFCCSGLARTQDSRSPSPETASPITGTVPLPNGSSAKFTYFFDHNALKDGVRVGDSLIALTESGNLIRFDPATLAMTGQAIVPGRGLSITSDDLQRVLVGTKAGEIFEVDPSSLTLQHVTSTQGKVWWLMRTHGTGKHKSTIIAGVDRTPDLWPWPGKEFKKSEWADKVRTNPYFALIEIDGVPRTVPWNGGGAYLLDHSGRLWMGADNGEWGGSCGYMNLRTGKYHRVASGIAGVRGIFDTSDGRRLVYGGTSHMGLSTGFIALVKNSRLETIKEFERNIWLEVGRKKNEQGGKQPAASIKEQKLKDSLRENTPTGPVDIMIDDLAGAGFWIVSEHILYHANAAFLEWKKIVELGGRWDAGNALSLSDTPTVQRLIADKARPGELIAFMGRDGVERISNGQLTRQAFAGQMESSVIDIWKTSSGQALVGDDDFHRMWRLSGTSWQASSLLPPEPPDKGNWFFAQPVGNEGSEIVSFVGDNMSTGDRDVFRFDDRGAAHMLDHWNGWEDRWDMAFLRMPDETLLKVAEDKLRIRGEDGWHDAGQSQLADLLKQPTALNPIFFGRRFILMGATSHGELFLDAPVGNFVELQRNAESSFVLAPLKYAVLPAPHSIFDAVPDKDGWLLVATPEGLMQFHGEDGAQKSILSPAGDEVRSLVRDAQGSLWAVGDGLYTSADEGQHWVKVPLPMLERTFTKRLRLDSTNPQKLILSLYDRGVVFVEW